jgi:hypothetical protein
MKTEIKTVTNINDLVLKITHEGSVGKIIKEMMKTHRFLGHVPTGKYIQVDGFTREEMVLIYLPRVEPW